MSLRVSLRSLIRRPGFTLLAVGALALGIGGTTAVFSLVNAVLLRGLPFAQPDRLVTPDVRSPNGHLISLSVPYYRAWSERSRAFASWGESAGWTFLRPGRDGSEALTARLVYGDFFGTLGMHAARGRLLRAADTERGAQPAVVLGYGYWQRAFGGDPSVIGEPLVTDGFTAIVVGVLPPGEGYPSADQDVYVPMGLVSDLPWEDRQSSFGMRALARLAPGATLASAQADLSRVASELASEHGEKVATPELRPLADVFVGDVRTGLWMLLGAVLLLLLSACANVANLAIARGEARGRELAVRTALGAGKSHLIGLLLSESALLAALGGVLGLAIAAMGVRVLPTLLPLDLPPLLTARVALSPAVIAFAFAVTVASGALFGLLPAFRLGNRREGRPLHHGTRGAGETGGREGRRQRDVLVVTQVALSLVLLIGAGLLARSLQRLSHVEKGFDASQVMSARLQVPDGTFDPPERRTAFYDELIAELEASPDVASAAGTLLLPLTDRSWERGLLPDSRPYTGNPDEMESVLYNVVTPAYFRTMGVQLLRGRGFTDADRENTPRVAVIDQTMAEKFWPGEDPVGRRVAFEQHHDGEATPPEWITVVGVAANVRHYELQSPSRIQIYLPAAQGPAVLSTIIVRHRAGAEATVAELVRRRVAALQPRVAIAELQSLHSLVAAALGPSRALGVLTLVFASLAALLSALGIFGVLSLAVARRSQEMGVRMAMGATPGSVLRLVAWYGVGLTLIGCGIGLVGALANSRLIGSLLFEVKPFDLMVYATVTAGMIAVAAVAAAAPAVRAARTDPSRLLREE